LLLANSSFDFNLAFCEAAVSTAMLNVLLSSNAGYP
jgi:hypothetical protein